MMLDRAMGLAVCTGVHKGNPQDAWRTLCHTSRMCPSCEQRKASRRAGKIKKRLEVMDHITEGDFCVGVLTATLPGLDHPSGIREGSLRDQYDYMTERRSNTHSMRGLNKVLKDVGAIGGSHFLEFTYNNKPWLKAYECWNLHSHSLFWAHGELDRFRPTSHTYEEDGELLLCKKNPNRDSRIMERLGFGKKYTLDYAEDFELEQLLRYSSKVAYSTKPFKAPKEKERFIKDFMIGLDGSKPHLARPFGDATKSIVSLPD